MFLCRLPGSPLIPCRLPRVPPDTLQAPAVLPHDFLQAFASFSLVLLVSLFSISCCFSNLVRKNSTCFLRNPFHTGSASWYHVPLGECDQVRSGEVKLDWASSLSSSLSMTNNKNTRHDLQLSFTNLIPERPKTTANSRTFRRLLCSAGRWRQCVKMLGICIYVYVLNMI